MKRFFVVGYRNARNINIPDLPEEVDLDIVFERLNVGDGVYVQNDLFGNVSIFCEDDKVDFVKEFLSDYTLVEDKPSPFVPQGIPNDPLFPYQKHHEVMESRYAWDVVANDASLRVGVIDSGIWPHPDLDSNRCKITFTYNGNTYTDCYGIAVSTNSQGNPVYIPLTSLTDTRNYSIRRDNIPPEYLDDIPLYSSHGTHVAGIVAARGNNGVGVSGMMWNVRDNNNNGGIFNIFPFYDVFNSLLTFFDTLSLASAAGCKVVNLSWGATLLNPDFNAAKMICEQIMQSAYESYGTIFVIAAGNYAIPINFGVGGMVPAACEVPNAITVTASSFGEGPTYYSNYGWKQALVGGYGGDGFYFRGTINEPDLSDPPPSMEHLKYNVLSTVGSSLDGEELSVVKYGGANYGSWAGTSMASPVVAGGLLSMLIAYKRKAGSLPTINKIRAMLKGVTNGHTQLLMQYNAAGGTYHHAYGAMAAYLSGSGYNPPSISVSHSDTDNTVTITLTNNDAGFRKMVLKLSLNRYCSPYENHQENQWSFSNVPAGGSRTVSINLNDYDSSENWGLCLTSYCEIASTEKYKHTYCNKYFIPLVDECPTINSSYVEFVSTNLKAYFEEFPNADQWENLNDANNLIDIYRLAHITLTKAYGSYMPPNGGIVALANDDGLFPREEYSIRVEVTENDVIYALVSLYKQLIQCVETGVLRYSAKFARKIWYYPLDTQAYWGTGTIKRRRVPDDWKFYLNNTKREDIKTIVGRIIKMCRWMSCLMGVYVTPVYYGCGSSAYSARHWGLDFSSLSGTVPNGNNCVTVDTRTNQIKINDNLISGLSCDGSNLELNSEQCAEGVYKTSSMGVLHDSRSFPFKLNTPTWFLKCRGLNTQSVEYKKFSFRPFELHALNNKNESQNNGSFSSPPSNKELWNNAQTVFGASSGDSPTSLTGQSIRNGQATFNLGGDSIAFYGVSGVTNITETNNAESYRISAFDVWFAVAPSVMITDFIVPIRVTHWLSQKMEKHVATHGGTYPQNLYPNNTYTLPCKQTFSVHGRTTVYKGTYQSEVVYDKDYTWSVHVPINNSGVDYYKLDDIVIDVDPETGYSVVYDRHYLDTVKANPVATFQLHFTPKELPNDPTLADLVSASETWYGNAYKNVIYGDENETFASNATWELLSATNVMEPYPVKYWGVGSYTRGIGVSSYFDFSINTQDWIGVPDLRGVPTDKLSDVAAFFGFTYEKQGREYSGLVFGRNKAEVEYCVEQIPPPGYVYDKQVTPKYIYGFEQEQNPSTPAVIEIPGGYIETPRFTVSLPTPRKRVKTIPDIRTPLKTTATNYAWVKNNNYITYNYIQLLQQLYDEEGEIFDSTATLVGVWLTSKQELAGKNRIVFPNGSDYPFISSVLVDGVVRQRKVLYVQYVYSSTPMERFYIPDFTNLRYSEAKSICDDIGYQIEIVGCRQWFDGVPGKKVDVDPKERIIVSQFPQPALRTFPVLFGYLKKIYVLLGDRYTPFESRWLF